MKQPEEPLTLSPIEDLKKVVRALIQVPKAEVVAAEAERPKSNRGPKKQSNESNPS